MSTIQNSRRSFIRNAGVAVSAALAGSGAVAATAATDPAGLLADSNAIRALQQRYFTLLAQGADATALFADNSAHTASKHAAVVLDARHNSDNIEVAHDRQTASARFSSRLQLSTTITGNGTLQQMARLQGQSQQQWNESGVYDVQYVKVGAEWKIKALQYRTA